MRTLPLGIMMPVMSGKLLIYHFLMHHSMGCRVHSIAIPTFLNTSPPCMAAGWLMGVKYHGVVLKCMDLWLQR